MSRTLADMTPEEQQACVGMWADIGSESAPMVIRYVGEVLAAAWVDPRHPNRGGRATMRSVTPRFDLMRAWNPDGTPVSANVSYDVQGYRETTDEWVDFFGHRRCTLRRAKRDLIEAREEKPNIKWRLAMRHEPHLMAIPDDYQEPGEGDE